jgi:hypothetical protein
MDPRTETLLRLTRRQLLGHGVFAAGAASLATIMGNGASGAPQQSAKRVVGLPDIPHHPPTAKRFIYLFMSGGPAQHDMYDYKPELTKLFDKDLPDSVRQGQRFTTMTSGQKRFPIAPSMFKFQQQGECGAWISELLPHTAKIVDDIAIIRSVFTNAINHDPAITFIQTGRELPGWPSLGAWLAYGLGVANENLPNYIVMTPTWTGRKSAQALYSRLWGTGRVARALKPCTRGCGEPASCPPDYRELP